VHWLELLEAKGVVTSERKARANAEAGDAEANYGDLQAGALLVNLNSNNSPIEITAPTQ
jgi:hypothetical protein